jgi:hypothetical protein
MKQSMASSSGCIPARKPKFAFKVWYAYATAPGWYLPRNQYAVVAIAPLVVLSLLGIILFLAFVPAGLLTPVLLFHHI